MRPRPLIATFVLVIACDKDPAPVPPDASEAKAEAKAETKTGTEAEATTVARGRGQPIQPPPSLVVPSMAASLDPVPEGPVVYVSRNDLSFGDEKLVALLDGQLDPGAVNGHLIGLLYERLHAHVQAQPAAAGGEPWEGPLVVVADTEVPYGTVLDVLYTGGRAGMRRYAFVAEGEPGAHGSIPVEPPRFDASPTPGEPEAAPLMVVIDSTGFEVRDQTQPDAEPGRIAAQAGKLYGAWDFEALGQRAQQYRQRQPTARSAAVSPSADTPWGIVLKSYAALRGSDCATQEESCVLPKLTALSPGSTSHSNTRQFDPAAAEAKIAALMNEDPSAEVGLIGAKPSDGSGSGFGTESSAGFGGRGKAVPGVQQAEAKVTGTLSPDIVRRIVRAHINEVRSCYTAALGRNPAAEGRVEVSFEVVATGSVEHAVIASSTLADEAMDKCVVKAVGRWKFPKPTDGKTVQISYPFILAPG